MMMDRGKKVFVILTIISTGVVTLGALGAWWFTKDETVTFYLQYPDAITVNTTLSVDGNTVIELINYTFYCIPAVSVGYTISLSKGTHTVIVYDLTYNVTSSKSFEVNGRLYVIAFVSKNGIDFHMNDKEPTFE